MQIVPMRDLKDTVKIEEMCAGENGPVFITKNGYGKLVVMNLDYFENLINQSYEAKAVNRGIADSDAGRTRAGNAVQADMRLKYGL